MGDNKWIRTLIIGVIIAALSFSAGYFVTSCTAIQDNKVELVKIKNM